MNEEIMEALESEILDEFEKLKNLAPGSEEQKTVVENIVKLQKIASEEGKLILDHEESRERLEMEKEQAEFDKNLKIEQEKSNKFFGWVKIGLEFVAITVPIAAYGYFQNKGLKFEETGTLTSGWNRKLVNMLSFKGFK